MTNYGNSDWKIMQTARSSNIYSQRKHMFQQNLTTLGKWTNKKGPQSQSNQSNQTIEGFVSEPLQT